jgi:hypothetical protein
LKKKNDSKKKKKIKQTNKQTSQSTVGFIKNGYRFMERGQTKQAKLKGGGTLGVVAFEQRRNKKQNNSNRPQTTRPLLPRWAQKTNQKKKMDSKPQVEGNEDFGDLFNPEKLTEPIASLEVSFVPKTQKISIFFFFLCFLSSLSCIASFSFYS